MLLLGARESKRTVFLRRAAERAGEPFTFLDWDEIFSRNAAKGSVGQNPDGAAKGTAGQSPDSAVNGTVGQSPDGAANGTVGQNLDGAANGTVGQNLDGAANGIAGQSPNGSIGAEWKLFLPARAAVKIDPPVWNTADLSQMQGYLEQYRRILRTMSASDVRFLNSPESILLLLDKRRGKECLQGAGIPTTKMYRFRAESAEKLIRWMAKERVSSVFIKPRFFSGAAGIMALRRHPAAGQLLAYTSCYLKNGKLINAKRLFAMRETDQILGVLEKIIELDCIIEKWHPKLSFQGKSFDLRVVYQFGHIADIAVRQSRGPITNLHLNNQACPVETIGLSERTMDAIEDVCQRAVRAVPGLQMAGIDILLEKGSGRPLVIEMNGQGDLLYQDIFGENRIYTEQIYQMGQQETEWRKLGESKRKPKRGRTERGKQEPKRGRTKWGSRKPSEGTQRKEWSGNVAD